MVGTDTVTLFKKRPDGTFAKHIVAGVQWSDKVDVTNADGRANAASHISVTFFRGTYEGLDLPNFSEEDVILFGAIEGDVTDGRVSALLKSYPKSGVIKSVNDNTNRKYLKHMKVVLA